MPRWWRAHGRSNAAERETTKHRHSRVLTRDTGHFYSRLRQRIIGNWTYAPNTALPGKLAIPSHPISAHHMPFPTPATSAAALALRHSTALPQLQYQLPPRLQRQPADAVLPPPRLVSTAGIGRQTIVAVLCQHGCTPARIAADNDMRSSLFTSTARACPLPARHRRRG